MKPSAFQTACIGLLALAGLATALAAGRHAQDLDNARAHFIETSQAETEHYQAELNASLSAIRQDLSTLAWLPSVRSVDRHAENLSTEAKITIQQIYNNLADDVAVSEVYIIPIDFDPTRLDPQTQKTEEPIIAFDQLIVDAGNGMSRVERQTHPVAPYDNAKAKVPEIEDYEYKQLVEHTSWMTKNFPMLAAIKGTNMPLISGSEVITCDNTDFIKTGRDKDRSGIIFSVPFYDSAGQIKGLISAIVRSNALQAMLPSHKVALVNPGTGYAVIGEDLAALPEVQDLITSAKPAPALAYSQAQIIRTPDARSPWYVWHGKPEADFTSGVDVKIANQNFRLALVAIVAALVTSLGIAWLLRRNFLAAHQLAASHATQRDMAQASERQAQENAASLQALNDNVSQLNAELARRLDELAKAQNEIVRKGRMAQMGQLVATVAHEIRNPLGSVRTSLFLMKRKMKDQTQDFLPLFQRIESGISRCDNIISQLLDFSRSQNANREATDMSAWLQSVVVEEVALIPEAIAVSLTLPEGALLADIDKERLRRCVVNLLANAKEALVSQADRNRDPAIALELRETARGTEILVSDNGPGIAQDVLPKIGEPLFTTKSFGTGLGLAATRKVAELHQGGLDIQSEPGKGATFTIWFPTKSEGEPKAA